jgi:DNA-binding NarL/FixJ family response regulator
MHPGWKGADWAEPRRGDIVPGMSAASATEINRRDLTILVSTHDSGLQHSLPATLSRLLGADCELRFTLKAHEREVRAAASLYAFDLVVVCVDTVTYYGEWDGRPQRALELVRELKERHGVALMLLSAQYPKGFTTAAEQAGVEGILELPCPPEALAEQVRSALALNAQMKAKSARAREARRRGAHLQPRVVVVDDSPMVREQVSAGVWSCWPKATVVACPDGETARAELARGPANLLIMNFESVANHDRQLLEWLFEQEVKYPVVILCDELLQGEPDAAVLPSLDLSCLGSNERNLPEAKARRGPSEWARVSQWVGVGGELVGKLWLHFWPRRFTWDKFTKDLAGLLDETS